jgi:hypothetical protein
MPTSIRSTKRTTFAASLMVLGVFTLPDAPAQAAAECLAAPNATTPQGRHWYYRLDRAAGRKCWYVAAQGRKSVRAAARARSASVRATTVPPVSTRPPPATRVESVPKSAWDGAQETAQESAQIRVRQLIYGTAQPVEADAPPQAEVPTSPAPAQPADRLDRAQPVTRAEAPEVAAEDNDLSAFAPAAPAFATRVTRAADTTTPAQMLLIVIAALAIAGSLLYATVALVLARRRRVFVDRRRVYPFGAAPVSTARLSDAVGSYPEDGTGNGQRAA